MYSLPRSSFDLIPATRRPRVKPRRNVFRAITDRGAELQEFWSSVQEPPAPDRRDRKTGDACHVMLTQEVFNWPAIRFHLWSP